MLTTETTAADLALVAGSDPSAVLLVDLATREVVFTNAVADQLAPGVALPVAVDAWADAARLRDLDGEPLADTDHPLSKLARAEPVNGQGVSAGRPSELGVQREPLWVVALPMTDVPQLPQHAVVLFLPLARRSDAEVAGDVARLELQLRERAVLATGMSFTVADARAEDQALVWVNPAFTVTTGYAYEEAVGRNCRFLQGPGTDPATPKAIRAALDAGEHISTIVLNHRKDGTAFWNQLSISPIHDAAGEVTHFVGVQTDVTVRILADAERDRALAAEREARADAEAAQARLRLLAEATAQLAGTLDVAQCHRRLVDLVVPDLADWAMVITDDQPGRPREVVARHARPDHEQLLREYSAALQRSLVQGSPAETLLGGVQARRISDYDHPERRAERESWVTDTEVLDRSDALGAASLMLLTLAGGGPDGDVLLLVRGPDSPRHTEADLEIAVDLTRRAGLIIDNARLYEREHAIAATLQSSLLPVLPDVPGLQVEARYQAAASGAYVGGDFYEVIPLPGGSVGVAIGDVVGHDVLAAAAMGHLRGLLRACAWDVARGSAATVLERVDDLLAGLGIPTMATMVYARLDPHPGGGWALTHSNAGHPPLLVRRADGAVEELSAPPQLMLGVAPTSRHASMHRLRPGDTLLACTDGLVERRDRDLTEGLDELRQALARGPAALPDLAQHLLDTHASPDDDTALLLLHVDG
ncbi:PP2C family protein-serine/threonine phosphatase [Angustibacter aerolatus]